MQRDSANLFEAGEQQYDSRSWPHRKCGKRQRIQIVLSSLRILPILNPSATRAFGMATKRYTPSYYGNIDFDVDVV